MELEYSALARRFLYREKSTLTELTQKDGGKMKAVRWEHPELINPPFLLSKKQEKNLRNIILYSKSFRQAFYLVRRKLEEIFRSMEARFVLEVIGIHSVAVAQALLNKARGKNIEDVLRRRGEKVVLGDEENLRFTWDRDGIWRNGKKVIDLQRENLSFCSFTMQVNRGGVMTLKIDFIDNSSLSKKVVLYIFSYKDK